MGQIRFDDPFFKRNWGGSISRWLSYNQILIGFLLSWIFTLLMVCMMLYIIKAVDYILN